MTDHPKEMPEMGEEPSDAPNDEPQAAPKRKLLMPPDWDEALDGEWDDEFASPEALAEGADIQLIVEYLNKRLEPEQMEAVRKRLEEDPAFAELAEPLIFVWKIPKHIVRHPRPEGETERAWEEFRKRVGISYQPPKAKPRRRWRPWIIGLALFVVAAAGLLARKPITEWYVTQRDFITVPLDGNTGWLHLGDSVFVDPAPGASLRASRAPVDERLHVRFEGEARFRLAMRDTATSTPFRGGMIVRTRDGIVRASEAEFTVAVGPDSTIVEVHRPTRRRWVFFVPVGPDIAVQRDETSPPLTLLELGRARLVRDQPPTRLPKAQEP